MNHIEKVGKLVVAVGTVLITAFFMSDPTRVTRLGLVGFAGMWAMAGILLYPGTNAEVFHGD